MPVNVVEYMCRSLMGDTGQFLAQAYLCGTPGWRGEDIPDLSGKVIIVTGGSSGIGKDLIKVLLQHNAKVYLAARNPAKSAQVIAELEEATKRRAIFLKMDLADLHSVKAAAEEFIAKESELHYLFINGGVMLTPIEETTVQGYDQQFGTNVLGHFYLTKLLLPTLEATAAATPNLGPVRIITTSSSASLFGHTFRREAHTGQLYTQSKVGNALVAMELASRYGDKGIVSNYCNPGNLRRTNLVTHVTGFLMIVLSFLLIYPSEWGAYTLLWAAFGSGSENTNGKYIIPWGRVGKPGPCLRNRELAPKLWSWLEQQVKDI
ncbi:NAD(P)-binding protein [Hymenopellis radicata]|nr:NAD(P)-binding protein [Hymenopellis radicata]